MARRQISAKPFLGSGAQTRRTKGLFSSYRYMPESGGQSAATRAASTGAKSRGLALKGKGGAAKTAKAPKMYSDYHGHQKYKQQVRARVPLRLCMNVCLYTRNSLHRL